MDGWMNSLGTSRSHPIFIAVWEVWASQRNSDSSMHGFFSAWSGTQGAKAMLLEYPPTAPENDSLYIEGTERGIENLVHMFVGNPK
jgi:hypothetical protein